MRKYALAAAALALAGVGALIPPATAASSSNPSVTTESAYLPTMGYRYSGSKDRCVCSTGKSKGYKSTSRKGGGATTGGPAPAPKASSMRPTPGSQTPSQPIMTKQ